MLLLPWQLVNCLVHAVVFAPFFMMPRYLLVGTSDPGQQEPYSFTHGEISSTLMDNKGMFRGDTARHPGDAGGGVFSQNTGHLMAINLAEHGDEAVLMRVDAVQCIYDTLVVFGGAF